MYNLPPELILYLFKFIPIQCILKLRNVSKKFKTLIDLYKPESLTIITSDRYIKYKLHNRFDKILIQDEELFFQNLSSLKLNKIKFLSIYIKGDHLINATNFYNQFTELEELKIDHLCTIKELTLNLDKLKSLKCNDDFHLNLFLNTPKLTYLNCYLLDSINFKYKPNKLIELIVKFVGEEKGYQLILKLKNLERLIVTNDCRLEFYKILLPKLLKLKELHIYQMYHQTYEMYKDEFLNSQFNVYGNKKIINTKIYINGFLLNHFNKIYSQEDNNINHRFKLQNYTLKYLINNYEQIDKLRARYELNYSELIFLNFKIPNDFCLKIQKIKEISILKYDKDEKKLLKFIENAKPNRLAIKGKCQKLSTFFFENLSKNCQFLNNIFIGKNQNLNQNIDSIIKFKNLKILSLNQQISIDILIKLIKLTNCNINGELNLTNHKTNPISFGYYLNYLDYNWSNLNKKSYLCFDFKHSTESETPEYDDEDESNFYTDDQELYIYEKIILNDFKMNIIQFLIQIKEEFKNKLDREDNNRKFMYFVNQFNYVQKLTKFVFRNMINEKVFYIDKNLLTL